MKNFYLKNSFCLSLANCQVFLILGLLMMGCDSEPQFGEVKGYVSREDDRWEDRKIKVCFEQDGYQVDKANIEKNVKPELAKAGIELFGWSKCSAEEDGLRVYLSDAPGSRVLDFGRRNDGLSNAIQLGLGHDCPVDYSGSKCQANIALHEFGHAIGLHHEMNRRDNPGCNFEQTGGQGEDGAVQIGDFDQQSIMNYCALFEANKQNIFMGFSEYDLKTIDLLYGRKTFAVLDKSLPKKLLSNNFSATVGGHDVAAYKYKIGIFEQTDCQQEIGYSSQIDVSEPIESNVLANIAQGKWLRLCLLGLGVDGDWQDLDLYSSSNFYVKNSRDQQAPLLHKIEWRFDLADDQKVFADVVASDLSDISKISLMAMYPESGQTIFSDSGKTRVTDQPNTWRLAFSRKKLNLKGKVLISLVTISDLNQNSGRYIADMNTSLYKGSKVPVAVYEVKEGVDWNPGGPKINGLMFDAYSYQVNQNAVFSIDIDTNNGIDTGLILLKHKISGRSIEKNLRLVQTVGGLWVSRFILPKTMINGEWYAARIELKDQAGNSIFIQGQDDLDRYKSTDIPMIRFAVTGGVDYEMDKPRLTEIKNVPQVIYRQKSYTFSFVVDEATGIDHMTVYFRHRNILWHGIYFNLSGPILNKDGLYEISFTPGANEITGDYFLESIDLQDTLGNYSFYQAKNYDSKTFDQIDLAVPKFLLPEATDDLTGSGE